MDRKININNDNKKPLVTIITACYNSEKTIEQTILSVVNQSYTNIEYIIVDGCSSDNTMDIVKKYAGEYSFIKYISEKDTGIYSAFNKGIKMSHGKLIGIINSDDWYEPDAVEKAVEMYQKTTNACVIYGMIRSIKNEKEYSIDFTNHHFIHERAMMHPAVFVSRSAYKKVGLFNENYRSAADYDLLIRMYKNNTVDFYPIYSILANFRLGGMSNGNTGYDETVSVLRKYNFITQKDYCKLIIIGLFRKILY